jgi:hypothetical protein
VTDRPALVSHGRPVADTPIQGLGSWVGENWLPGTIVKAYPSARFSSRCAMAALIDVPVRVVQQHAARRRGGPVYRTAGST